jgi:hypothetical protein
MDGSLKATLPRSGFVQPAVKQGQKTVGFASSSLILTNYF